MSTPARDDKMWGLTPLPDHVEEIRDQQWEATEEAVESFKSGDDVVYLEAPTGAGKSLIADLVRRLLDVNCNMVCTTKELQRQYESSFPYGRVIMGRSNYPTQLGNVDEWGNSHARPWSAITCADCTFNGRTEECKWCWDRYSCPFPVAQRKAMSSQLAILNTAYCLTDWKYAGKFKGRGITVMDEADRLEGEVLNLVEVEIPKTLMEEMMLLPPKRKTAGDDGKGAVEWASWIHNQALPCLELLMANLSKPWDEDITVKGIRKWERVSTLYDRLTHIKAEIAMGGWVYDGMDEDKVIFRPVKVEKYGSESLWPGSQRFLIMSATILSADLMNDELGGYLPYSSISMPSTFPAENRPVYVCPVADMSKKAKKESEGRTWERMVEGVRAVLERHPDDRVLVHTVSYELARYLKDGLKLLPSAPTSLSRRPILIYQSSDEKRGVLEEYKRTKGSVLLAASMDRGVDLPDELCRVQVVAKIPFLSLGDRRINARLHSPGGGSWYRMDAIRSLIQMTGRGVRHKEDHATTYILDESFTNNLWKYDWLFPPYWREATRWNLTAKHLLGAGQ